MLYRNECLRRVIFTDYKAVLVVMYVNLLADRLLTVLSIGSEYFFGGNSWKNSIEMKFMGAYT